MKTLGKFYKVKEEVNFTLTWIEKSKFTLNIFININRLFILIIYLYKAEQERAAKITYLTNNFDGVWLC